MNEHFRPHHDHLASVEGLKSKLLEIGGVDVQGPMRIARGRFEDEVNVGGKRLLLIDVAKYEDYAHYLTAASLLKLEVSPDYNNLQSGVFALDVPTDTIALRQVLNTRPDRQPIVGYVFRKTGHFIRQLIEATGKVPEESSIDANHILTLRRQGEMTLLPPTYFTTASHDALDSIETRFRQDLSTLKDPTITEYMINEYRAGLRNE